MQWQQQRGMDRRGWAVRWLEMIDGPRAIGPPRQAMTVCAGDDCRIPLQDLEVVADQRLLVAQRLVVAEEGIGLVQPIVAVLALPF